jgi:hypothetical protein
LKKHGDLNELPSEVSAHEIPEQQADINEFVEGNSGE